MLNLYRKGTAFFVSFIYIDNFVTQYSVFLLCV